MNFNFTALKRQGEEELWQFDSRISAMLPIVAGYVYFDGINYDGDAGDFNVYIRWEDELNGYMNDRLPETGFFVRATWEQARELLNIGGPLPVYIKLISVEGRLYPYRKYILLNGRPFSVEYNGSNAFFVEICQNQAGTNPTANTGIAVIGGSQRSLISGSQRSIIGSSQRSVISGSQQSIISGSQRSIIGSSQRSLISGSQRSVIGSSQRSVIGSSQRSIISGSQRSVIGSSQRSIISGSQRGVIGGSQRNVISGSQHGGCFGGDISPSGEYTVIYEGNTFKVVNSIGHVPENNDRIFDGFPMEWQLINRGRRPEGKRGGNGSLGYGLDLI